MSNFIPSLFIGIGETGALFTLRETYEHVYYGRGEVVNGVFNGTVERLSLIHI